MPDSVGVGPEEADVRDDLDGPAEEDGAVQVLDGGSPATQEGRSEKSVLLRLKPHPRLSARRDAGYDLALSMSQPAEPTPAAPVAVDPLLSRIWTLDLVSSLLAAATLAVIEMGGAIAKKGFQATDYEVALLISGQSVGLILSFFIAHLASRRPKRPLVFWPELLSRLLLVAVFFLGPRQALVFVALHALAQMFQAMTTPARVTIYRLNYPSATRGRIVGRIRQFQLVITALAALALAVALDWNQGEERMVRLLGPCPFAPHAMMQYAVPAAALLGLAGCFVFLRLPVSESADRNHAPASIAETFRKFVRVYREDRDFRRYENFFFLFGFANIMAIPLTQIHAVEALHADYFDLAMINVILVQGLMAATMVFWGRKLDRHTPGSLRGVLNIIFSLDFLFLALAPTIGWVYVGRIFRGIALGGGTLIWMLGSLYYARSSEQAPVYLGIHTVLTGVRWLMAPFAGVLLKRAFGHDARPIFFICFAVILTTAILMLYQSRHEVRREPPAEPPMPAPRTTGA